MTSYIRGWVKAGSSPSLWPCLRYPIKSITKSLWKVLPVLGCHPDRLDTGFRVVCIDVNNRHLESLRQVARVQSTARVVRVRSETELVIGDYVDGTARPVATQPRQVESFGYYSLPGESGIAVNQDRYCDIQGSNFGAGQHGIHLRSSSSRHTHDHRIDRLQMARIRRNTYDQASRVVLAHLQASTLVILHVSGVPDLAVCGDRDGSGP
jgi:hypothetical protein